MKKQLTILFLLLLQSCLAITIYAQGGTWTWISGSSNLNSLGVYGTQGVPSVNNHPPGVYETCEWKDKQGNFWIYGGIDFYSDLWKFNPTTLEWTWIKGNGFKNQVPIYGTKGVANFSNTPGLIGFAATTWVDTSGNFWLFGGGYSSNALWKYELSTNMWTWVSGSTNTNAYGIYGIKGIPSIFNSPGIRQETCSGWTDSLDCLWLFGGKGNGASSYGSLNDLWKFNITNGEWTWMAGDLIVNVLSIYGIKGVSNFNNNPGGRWSYTKWKNMNGDFWIFGGGEFQDVKNDVWKFQPALNEWVWMNGSTSVNSTGNYNISCLLSAFDLPFSRIENRSSITDNCGRFWTFAGFRNNNNSALNDLWIFDPQQLKWVLLSGYNLTNQSGSYGILGIPSLNNQPASRG
ncbi:MAG TPA: kelch repeat-containing protein [Bacteroidia bacterium]|nr:kelch repeat-containing protein [Bacteroidia bacterium]